MPDRQGQGIRGPPCGHRRDPLIMPVGEAALKILLKFRSAAGDVPRAICALRMQEELYALGVRAHHAGFIQSPKCHSCAICIAWKSLALRPTTIGAL